METSSTYSAAEVEEFPHPVETCSERTPPRGERVIQHNLLKQWKMCK